MQGMFLSFFLRAALVVLFILGIRDNLRQRAGRLDRIARQIEEEKVVMRLGLLAGTAAPDTSTPLTNLAVILDDWLDLGLPDETEQRRQIAPMQEAVSTCRESLTQMLAMGGRSRVEAARAADPLELLRAVAGIWQARYPEVAITFRDQRTRWGTILADLLLTRALTILLDNAREARARTITLIAEDDGARVVLHIRDDGAGFPDTVLQGVTPPVPGKATPDGSHGLGLFLVRSALRRMRVAGFDPRQAMKWLAAARRLASKPVIGAVLAGIGNLCFKVSQTLPGPPEQQVQITDLIGECRDMGLSRRAYAALRGVHESAVGKAIASGRITTEADGTIDAAKADAMWDAATDPAKQRGAHDRDLARHQG